MGRRGDEKYALYCTGSCAGSKENGFADVPKEL